MVDIPHSLKEADRFDSNPGNWAPELIGAATLDSHHSLNSLLLNQWPNSDGILAWVLYLLGSAFLVADDNDSVLEILEILRPIDNNLAALLSSKVNHPG